MICGVYFENSLLGFDAKTRTFTFNTPSASEYKMARRDVNLFCGESVLLENLFKLFTSESLMFVAIASLSPGRSAFETLASYDGIFVQCMSFLYSVHLVCLIVFSSVVSVIAFGWSGFCFPA